MNRIHDPKEISEEIQKLRGLYEDIRLLWPGEFNKGVVERYVRLQIVQVIA